MAINQKNIKPGQQDDFLRIQELVKSKIITKKNRI